MTKIFAARSRCKQWAAMVGTKIFARGQTQIQKNVSKSEKYFFRAGRLGMKQYEHHAARSHDLNHFT